jgi:hypothetical protein
LITNIRAALASDFTFRIQSLGLPEDGSKWSRARRVSGTKASSPKWHAVWMCGEQFIRARDRHWKAIAASTFTMS